MIQFINSLVDASTFDDNIRIKDEKEKTAEKIVVKIQYRMTFEDFETMLEWLRIQLVVQLDTPAQVDTQTVNRLWAYT